MNNRNKILILALPFLLISFNIKALADDLVRIKDLKGLWKFSIGEREEWISPNYDDSNWESVQVPSPWENQGFYGYNGYAFYRKSITISNTEQGKMLYLALGFIDDVDETYFNGHKIGSTGSFPPKYETAYNAERKYFIPEEIINFDGDNVLAVKVYDSYQAGGIVSGDISIYTTKMGMQVDFNLQGSWKFRIGDDLSGKEPEFDDSNWDEIFVPAKWEDQGYRDYDGYAWYRKTFVYKANSTDDKMVVIMGKIDDIDQVFINGTMVGSTGDFPVIKANDLNISGQEYNAFRGYYFATVLLKKNQKNVIAVRVYDKWGAGGIYEGPVGIISQTKYIEFWRKNKSFNR
jgi:sialate O-acetylesterase